MKKIRTYVFVFVPVSVNSRAHASTVRRIASCFSPPDRDEGIVDIRRDAERGTLEASAPQDSPFWTWFIENPRPSPP